MTLKQKNELDIDYIFLYKQALVASHDLIPWFMDYSNYLESDAILGDLSFHQ